MFFSGVKNDIHIINPYSVVTQPKTTKGPRSCPGAPMESDYNFNRKNFDGGSQANYSSRYENVMGPRKRGSFSTMERSENRSDRSPTDFGNRQYKNIISTSQAYDHYDNYESDDDEIHEARARIQHLESKMQRMQRRWFEERAVMSQQLEHAQDECFRLKKMYDRVQRSHGHLKVQMEKEKMINSNIMKMLQEANQRIEILESGNESGNTSSLLCPYGQTLLGETKGAGEALALQEDPQPSAFFPDTACLISQGTTAIKDDLDSQDEVRIFRTVESGISSPLTMETARRTDSPLDLASFNIDVVLTHKVTPTRSHSDSDIFNSVLRDNSEATSVEEEPVIQKLWKPSAVEQIVEEESSSEDEVVSLIERQLRKRGDLVKFNPPRQAIHPRHFRRFGKMERTALAEFEYLEDISTDVSGMLSSPEVNQHYKAATLPRV
ncbi:unnamed protein product [Caenorhabditis auriculariae]|uniref:Uncharacterized protein n=1 Tax=Caenorhabditis auriculariae TaxID=2777116 RepID=A0A8S1GNB0_9PELO|nr:unnamed protein product [Caenorhabditis auriculariae]